MLLILFMPAGNLKKSADIFLTQLLSIVLSGILLSSRFIPIFIVRIIIMVSIKQKRSPKAPLTFHARQSLQHNPFSRRNSQVMYLEVNSMGIPYLEIRKVRIKRLPSMMSS